MSDARNDTPPRPPQKKPGAKQRHYRRWNLFSRLGVGLLILGCVAAGAIFLIEASKDEGVGSTEALLDDIVRGIEDFEQREKRPPNTIAEMVGPQSPYKGAPIPEDYWRTRIEYRPVPGEQPAWRVRSLGADKKAGTADDIVRPAGKAWPSADQAPPLPDGAAQPGSGR